MRHIQKTTGRIPKYTNADELAAIADDFFDELIENNDVPTINGLCLALDMTRETFAQYGKKPEFSDVIIKIRMRLESWWEKRLAGPASSGTTFWLKNHGWSDRVENVVSNPDGTGLFSGIEVRLVRPSDT